MPVRSRSPAPTERAGQPLAGTGSQRPRHTLACPNRARSGRGATRGRTGCWGHPHRCVEAFMTRRDFGTVRRWHAGRLRAGVGRSTVAKAYRLLKAIPNTAVADEVLPRNPCLLRAAGSERTPERVPPTLAEACMLAEAIQPRWRMLVLLATWSGLRWGELVALRRSSVDLEGRRVTVADQLVETATGVNLGPPKTDARRSDGQVPRPTTPLRDPCLDQRSDHARAHGADGPLLTPGSPARLGAGLTGTGARKPSAGAAEYVVSRRGENARARGDDSETPSLCAPRRPG